MRTTAMLTIAAMAGECAWAGSTRPTQDGLPGGSLTICMELGFDVLPLRLAEKLASKMLADIGVETEWPQRLDSCTGAIVVTLSYETPATQYRHAYAYAMPYEGTHIVVFWDRIQHKVPPPRAPILLAHVLVHEITHILQRSDRHSESGVMKASWSDDDLFQMGKKPLAFTELDVVLIHAGVAAHSLALLSRPK